MNRCSYCQRGIPDDAAFCIHCAAPLRPAPQRQPQEPATGATIRLNPVEMNAPVQPIQPQPVLHKWPKHHAHSKFRHGARQGRQDVLGPVFLIGILCLLATNTFFPGILVLLGLLGFIRATRRGRSRRALKQLVFVGAMALLFWSGRFWPGILLLVFASHLFSGSRYSWRP